MVGRTSRRYRSGRESHPKVWKWSETRPKVWNWSRDPLGGPEVVGKPSRRTGSGGETLQEIRKWLETYPEVWNWSGELPGGPEVVEDHPRGGELVRRHSWKFGSGREILPEVR